MDAQPTPVTTPAQAFDAVSDGTHLYWAEPNNHTVYRINKDPFACLPEPVCEAEVFAVSQARPWALAIDETHVYWIALQTNQEPFVTPRLERCAKGEGRVETMVEDLVVRPGSMTEYGDFVYWIAGNEGERGELQKIRKPL